MGRLLLVNGLPGTGKSMLANRYAADRPLSLCLDIDVVRELIGCWLDDPSTAGDLARQMAVAMAREVLADGHDVVVPQLLARVAFIERLAALAERCSVEFVEVLLLQEPDRALERLAARAGGPMTTVQHHVHVLLDRQGRLGQVVPDLHRRLLEVLELRPHTRVLEPTPDDIELTYGGLLELLDGPAKPRGVTFRAPVDRQH